MERIANALELVAAVIMVIVAIYVQTVFAEFISPIIRISLGLLSSLYLLLGVDRISTVRADM